MADLVRRTTRKREQAAAWQRKQEAKLPAATDWVGWFDGSAWPNPGRIGLGAILRSPDGLVTEISRHGGHGDSNEAEYLALLALLELALQRRPARLVIHGDSRVVIDDVTASHRVAGLDDYRQQVMHLIGQLPAVRFQWIPRHRNTGADALSQRVRQA